MHGPALQDDWVKQGVAGEKTPAARIEGDVLIVEDNVIIAMDAENIMRELGFARCHIAVSVSEALGIIAQRPIGLALLDISLRDETCEEIAMELRQRGTPFIFASGYDDPSLLPGGFDAIPLVAKPYSVRDVRTAIAELDFE
jgi:CheY-like chemotaxis protein